MSIADELDEFRAENEFTRQPKRKTEMSDTENVSPTVLLDQAIEDRLAPEAKSATADVDPRLRAAFIHAVAQACDIVDLTPQQICGSFALVAVEGLDRALVERPANVKTNFPRPAPEHLYAYDRVRPHRVPEVQADPELGLDFPLGFR